MGTADLPNFFRKPYGPGWALVGDAGYHKDPITGYGITDAFRDAETLSAALIAGLSGKQPMPSAGSEAGSPQILEELADYERQRNEFAFPLYELICQLASMEAPPPEMQALQAALVGNQEAITRFFGVLDGTISVPEFFAPEHIGAIMAAAQQRSAAA
jgi:2-polyprenyl-6-methoxyphenol hydroxylase-like FAD-dependent oxidoreductase